MEQRPPPQVPVASSDYRLSRSSWQMPPGQVESVVHEQAPLDDDSLVGVRPSENDGSGVPQSLAEVAESTEPVGIQEADLIGEEQQETVEDQ